MGDPRQVPSLHWTAVSPNNNGNQISPTELGAPGRKDDTVHTEVLSKHGAWSSTKQGRHFNNY